MCSPCISSPDLFINGKDIGYPGPLNSRSTCCALPMYATDNLSELLSGNLVKVDTGCWLRGGKIWRRDDENIHHFSFKTLTHHGKSKV